MADKEKDDDLILAFCFKRRAQKDYFPVNVIVPKGAVAGDYISFFQGVAETVLGFARAELEAEANRQGRTLSDKLTPVFGSTVIQIPDKTVNTDGISVSAGVNEVLGS